MAVNPSFQRRGIGSMMMRRICEETDRYRRCAYVLAAPEGVRLYKKFDFEIVGRVQTPGGIITSMLRPSKEIENA
jgi:ribosomal protein S18 acetylase RimI-like enzyme